MQVKDIISGLEKNIVVFQALFDVDTPDLIGFKPTEDAWSVLEIVCHLLDEEREDFRARVKLALFSPGSKPAPISPTTWPMERKYEEQDFREMVHKFLQERESSVQWLKGLEAVDWNNQLDRLDLGNMSALNFLQNWLAHDYHHIRQLNAIKHAFLKATSADGLSYAGKW